MMPAATFPWLNSNVAVDYPFEDGEAFGLRRLFVDAYVLHTVDVRERLAITSFDPTAQTVKAEFEDATLLADLNPGNSSVIVSDFGPYRLFEWRKVSAVDGPSSAEAIIRLVVLTASLVDFVFPITPTDAWLLASLVVRQPPRVRQLALKQPGIVCCTGGGYGSGAVRLDAGNNIDLPAGTDRVINERVAKNIRIGAVAGSGLGVFQACPDGDGSIKTIGTIGPDKRGNVSLEGADCTWVERVLGGATAAPVNPFTDYSAPSSKSLKLHSDCKACCDCSDYKAAYEALLRVWNYGKTVSARYQDIKDRYDSLSASAAAIMPAMSIDLTIITRPDFHLAISATFGNGSDAGKTGVLVRFDLSPAASKYTEGSGILKDTDGTDQVDPTTGGDSYFVFLPNLEPGEAMSYAFEVRWFKGALRLGGVARVVGNFISSAGSVSVTKTAKLSKPMEKT